MTFQEWRAMYPGVPVCQPHPEAPDVYLISGRDPLNQGGGTSWDPPMHALFMLSDYNVTTYNQHRGSVWVAPRVERDDWTRSDYMNSRIDHHTYYLGIARLIGLPELERYVLQITNREQLMRVYPDLNLIHLSKWDGLDFAVKELVRARNRERGIMARTWNGTALQPGTICWSLSETVCVTKAVARDMVERWQHANTPIAT